MKCCQDASVGAYVICIYLQSTKKSHYVYFPFSYLNIIMIHAENSGGDTGCGRSAGAENIKIATVRLKAIAVTATIADEK